MAVWSQYNTWATPSTNLDDWSCVLRLHRPTSPATVQQGPQQCVLRAAALVSSHGQWWCWSGAGAGAGGGGGGGAGGGAGGGTHTSTEKARFTFPSFRPVAPSPPRRMAMAPSAPRGGDCNRWQQFSQFVPGSVKKCGRAYSTHVRPPVLPLKLPCTRNALPGARRYRYLHRCTKKTPTTTTTLQPSCEQGQASC